MWQPKEINCPICDVKFSPVKYDKTRTCSKLCYSKLKARITVEATRKYRHRNDLKIKKLDQKKDKFVRWGVKYD